MSKEYVCDNCNEGFDDRDWMWPVDERSDFCGEDCFEEARSKGKIEDCPACDSDVTAPHNCHWLEFAVEEDGRWIAEVRNMNGVMAYGATKQEATLKVMELARSVRYEETK